MTGMTDKKIQVNKIIDFLLKPFGENLAFFLALWLLASAADIFFYAKSGNPVFGIYMGLHGLIQVYVVVLLCGFLKEKVLKVAKIILLILGVVSMIADACVHKIMNFSFTKDMVAIILGSNPSEASEFLPMYLNAGVLGFIGVVLAIMSGLLVFERQISAVSRRWLQWLLLALVALSVLLVSLRHSRNWEGVFLNKIGLFLSYESPENLTKYRQDVEVSVEEEQPANLVLIFGESLSKRHCSLYGYEKETTPIQESMVANSTLLRFTNIQAAWTHTLDAFSRMMTTFDNQPGDDLPWYKHLYLHDVLAAAGYKTIWISNQSSAGIWDNGVAKIAALSDTTEWVGPKGMSFKKSNPDGDVLPYVKSFLAHPLGDKQVFMVHLMGSHAEFSARYPDSFAHFSEEDYPNAPIGQRKNLMDYDNSIRYNDWVVSEIMHCFDDQEAIVLSFPDHGLDFYYTDPGYAGHARTSDPLSVQYGREIPFVAYPTKLYREHFPRQVQRLEAAREKEYNLEDLLYTVMDLAGARFPENDMVREKSLLQ